MKKCKHCNEKINGISHYCKTKNQTFASDMIDLIAITSIFDVFSSGADSGSDFGSSSGSSSSTDFGGGDFGGGGAGGDF